MLYMFMRRIKNMRFDTVDELYNKIDDIKELYNSGIFTEDEKEVYKWYFFNQLCLVKFRSKTNRRYLKDSMWSYINDVEEKINVIICYKDFCNYRKSIMKKKNCKKK